MNRFWPVFLCLSLFIHNHSFASLRVAKVLYTKGEVKKKSGRFESSVKKDDLLDHGDHILTSDSSLAVLAMGKDYGSRIKVIEKSDVRVEMQERVPETEIMMGGIVALVKEEAGLETKKDVKFRVKTKSASLGVRGTEFFAFVGPENSTLTTVEKGTVEMSSAQSENALPLTKSQGSMTNAEGKVIAPKKFSWAQKVNWKVDPVKGDLSQSNELFSEIQKSWQDYKAEQEYRFETMKKEQEKVWNEWTNQGSESEKDKFFNN